jgi:hypothetical protein
LKSHDLILGTSNKRSAPGKDEIRNQQKKKPKKVTPYVIVWVCHYGPKSHSSRDHGWSSHEPRIFGIYNSKAEAEAKKEEIISHHGEGGYSDVCVGDEYSDEIDLLVRPVEEYVSDGDRYS